MKLSDVMSHADLAAYPKVALVIFFAVFAAVLVKLARTPGDELARCGRMALDEGEGEAGAGEDGGTGHG